VIAFSTPISIRFRLPLLFIAMLSLVGGIWTGLSRIGWDLNLSEGTPHHGAIMVGGFIGTLISLEKMIPLKSRFLFVIPCLSGSSLVFFLSGQPLIAFACLVLASTGLCSILIYYLWREKNLIYALMAAGGVCWLSGNALLMSTKFYPLAFPWWLGFGLFIITAERLELMKLLPVSARTKMVFIVLLAGYMSGILFSFHGNGSIISAVSLIGISIWLLRFDVIGISIRKSGLTRFVGTSLMCGYVAMLLTGILMLSLDTEPLAYDAVVHAFFLGFVFSMIFAHGPIILPGVLGIAAKPYHRILYAWLALLHASWIIRMFGDALLDFTIRKHSGYITTVAILGYFFTIAILTAMSQRRHAKVL
jgi:hypothetical protein